MIYKLGIIGYPVSQSLSPEMHRAALAYCGLKGDYTLLAVEPANLDQELPKLISDGFVGINVTIPHKEIFFRIAHKRTKEAERARAANTIKFQPDSTMVAHNTDVEGLTKALEQLMPNRESCGKALLIGAGGAARAALISLCDQGYEEITVVARNKDKAFELVADMKGELPEHLRLSAASPQEAADGEGLDLIVNATPMGQKKEVPVEGWIDPLLRRARGHGTFFDMVYSRGNDPTPLVQMALGLGLEAADGRVMLVEQGRASFSFWTGAQVPYQVMHRALLDAITMQ